jgi:hypothetical protein
MKKKILFLEQRKRFSKTYRLASTSGPCNKKKVVLISCSFPSYSTRKIRVKGCAYQLQFFQTYRLMRSDKNRLNGNIDAFIPRDSSEYTIKLTFGAL